MCAPEEEAQLGLGVSIPTEQLVWVWSVIVVQIPACRCYQPLSKVDWVLVSQAGLHGPAFAEAFRIRQACREQHADELSNALRW